MNLLSINNLSKTQVLQLIERADYFRASKNKSFKIDNSTIAGLLFFEPSTRTRIGFEAATWKLGYKSVLLNEAKPSVSKGWSESMSDTIRIMNAYVDMYFIRHPEIDIFEQVLPFTNKPVINCGNGYDEHPSQALIDAYAIWHKFGSLDNLAITFIGDTRYSRSAHSLALLLSKFKGLKIQEITPKILSMPREYVSNMPVTRITKDELGQEQVLYSAGFPPINPSGNFSQDIIKKYIVRLEDIAKLQPGSVVMNPLPRIDEIEDKVDDTPQAYYFEQNELGLYMRMAIVRMAIVETTSN